MYFLWLEVKNSDRFLIDDIEKVLRKKCSDFGMGNYSRFNAGWDFTKRQTCLSARRVVRSFFKSKKKHPIDLQFWKVVD